MNAVPQDREAVRETPATAHLGRHPSAVPKPRHDNVPISSTAKDEEWKGWKLQWLTMSFMVFMEGGLIAAIASLAVRSATQNGIVTFPQATAPISSFFAISKIWKYGLLWTTLPSLVMTFYKIAWESPVSATVNRQPFVELKRGASAKKTTMLGYRSYHALTAWTNLFANGHALLGCAMFVGQAFSIVVIPLTAHLFVAALSQSTSTVALSFPTTYDEFGLENTTSLQPAIDLAIANRVYNGTPPP